MKRLNLAGSSGVRLGHSNLSRVANVHRTPWQIRKKDKRDSLPRSMSFPGPTSDVI